jgi:hypothetical protein
MVLPIAPDDGAIGCQGGDVHFGMFRIITERNDGRNLVMPAKLTRLPD